MMHPILLAIGACVLAAALESAFAGPGVKQRFAELRMPRLSPPLAVWSVIGVVYYLICALVLHRLLSIPSGARSGRDVALALAFVVLLANAFWNYLFFRLRSLHLSFLLSVAYSLLAAALLIVLFAVDRTAAWWFVLYAPYLIYANVCGYALLRANPEPGPDP
jgi:tryptophan-rich sensory protein